MLHAGEILNHDVRSLFNEPTCDSDGADSASTVTHWTEKGSEERYFKGANKIFQLSDHNPVGLMDLNLWAGMAPSVIAPVGSGCWIVGPIALAAVAIVWAHGVLAR
jgi:hypothetical protein